MEGRFFLSWPEKTRFNRQWKNRQTDAYSNYPQLILFKPTIKLGQIRPLLFYQVCKHDSAPIEVSEKNRQLKIRKSSDNWKRLDPQRCDSSKGDFLLLTIEELTGRAGDVGLDAGGLVDGG